MRQFFALSCIIATAIFSITKQTHVAAETASSNAIAASTSQRKLADDSRKLAYVTLLWGDFCLPTRVLGQSIVDSGTTHDRVVLVTPDVSETTRQILSSDGWKVHPVKFFSNPNARFQTRLEYIYTKLEAWRLTDYDRVVYIDADATVIRNIDEMFECGPFCAIMRQAELFNGGVLVLDPSEEVYQDMVDKASTLYSYTGGDQGFLNSYFDNFAACPSFEPMLNIGMTGDVDEDGKKVTCRRLPQRYNGDWGFAMLNGSLQQILFKGNAPPEEFLAMKRAAIMHYTFGSLKPWAWWSAFILPYSHLWTDVADKLPALPSGKSSSGGGKNMASSTNEPGGWGSVLHLLIIPPLFLILVLAGLLERGGRWLSTTPRYLAALVLRRNNLVPCGVEPSSAAAQLTNVLVGLLSLFAGFCVAWSVVPTFTRPGPGWTLFFLYIFSTFFSLYGVYLCQWFHAGYRAHCGGDSGKKVSATAPPMSSFSSQLRETLTFGAVLVVWTTIFVSHRVTARMVSFGQVVPPLIGWAVLMAIGCCVAFVRLPIAWHGAFSAPSGGTYDSVNKHVV